MNELWLRQVRGILRLELRKNLFSLRAAPIYLLSSVPLFLVGGIALYAFKFGLPQWLEGPNVNVAFFAGLYQFILRFVVYFGSVWLFMNLFRGEVLDQSLHFYFLTPIRRELLVAGKYFSAMLATTLVFGGTTLVCFLTTYGFLGTSGPGSFLGRSGSAHLLAYLLVTVLGCLGYGALFLVVGLFFRNPIIPAVAIFFWEGLNPFLPGLLKKLSVIFYLQSLFPVQIPAGPFEVIVEPVSPWLGVPGLLLFTILTLFAGALHIRRMEIAYGVD